MLSLTPKSSGCQSNILRIYYVVINCGIMLRKLRENSPNIKPKSKNVVSIHQNYLDKYVLLILGVTGPFRIHSQRLTMENQTGVSQIEFSCTMQWKHGIAWNYIPLMLAGMHYSSSHSM